jgi:SAM-dependent methyltransferase
VATPEESPDRHLLAYYEERAPYYDDSYAGPRPAWLALMTAAMVEALRGRHVLELACGTGQWTQRLAADPGGGPASVTAVDPSPAMRAIAARRLAGWTRVRVLDGDAYALAGLPGAFDGGLAMQWFSHVPAARRDEFLAGWHARLGPGAVIFLGDNQLTPRWADRLVRPPGSADTYEPRTVPDGGGEYLIVKNYFTEAELRAIFQPVASDLAVTMGRYWWWLSYRLPG